MSNLALKETRLALRNSTTRIPFRYGSACLTCCPQAILQATVEINGKRQTGYSGDGLPPGWFDKSPEKDFRQQLTDMLEITAASQKAFANRLRRPTDFFSAWRAAQHDVELHANQHQYPPLLGNLGFSLVERAIIDAICRANGVSFHTLCRDNLLGIDAESVHPELAGRQPKDWISAKPLTHIFVRHTVGIGDPLTEADVHPGDRPADGFPFTLEECLQTDGVRYLKIKLTNQLDYDLERLHTIDSLLNRYRGDDYNVTLDCNEQYGVIGQLQQLVAAMRESESLRTLLSRSLAIEQPLNRMIAFSADHTKGIRELGETVPVIIDESDGQLESFRTAVEQGYRGVTSKNCKGTIKVLLNAGLVWHLNQRDGQRQYIMTGEDLCSVGIIPVQADLCLAATLGLEHVERNGHYYHPGLSYLPEQQQRAALAAHPDFYYEHHGRIAPHVQEGRLHIASLQCPGFGFSVEPDLDRMQPADQWDYDSLDI